MNRLFIDPLESRRLMAAGDLLESFGRNGAAVYPRPMRDVTPATVAMLPDGKLLLGVKYQGTQPGRDITRGDFVRYNADGTVDGSFDHDGILDTFLSSVTRIAPRSDGLFYALGQVAANDASGSLIAGTYVARFRADGSLDRRFGDRGKVRIDTQSVGSRRIDQTILTSDGFLWIMTRTYGATGKGKVVDGVFRFGADGRLDAGFANGGFLGLSDAYTRVTPTSIAVDRTGDLMLSAVYTFKRQTQDAIYRFKTDGTPDPAFGVGGKALLGPSTTGLAISALRRGYLVQRVRIDKETDPNLPQFRDFTMMTRLTASGAVDRSFGTSGTVEWPLRIYPGAPCAVVEQQNGQLVVVTLDDTRRLNADGSIDESFGRVTGVPVRGNEDNRPVDIAVGANDVLYFLANGLRAMATQGSTPSPIRQVAGELVVEGTSRDDTLQVRLTQREHGLNSEPADIVEATRNRWGRRFARADVQEVRVEGGTGHDRIDFNLSDRVPVTLIGGPGNDTIESNAYAPATVSGGDGNDTLTTDAGGDFIEGGNGDDAITASEFRVRPGPFVPTTVYGGAGNDLLLGRDRSSSSPAAQYLFGGLGDDTLDAGRGNDSLVGGAGRDVLRGGPGDDTLDADAEDLIVNR